MSLNRSQLNQLWRQYQPTLTLIVRAWGKDTRSEVDDAVQEAFVKLAGETSAPIEPLAWLVRVAVNRLKDNYRRQARRVRREEIYAREVWFQKQNDTSSRFDSNELTEALERLDEASRRVVVMHLWGKLNFDTIAETLGTSRSSAHRTYQSAIRSLRTILQESQSATTTETLKGDHVRRP